MTELRWSVDPYEEAKCCGQSASQLPAKEICRVQLR